MGYIKYILLLLFAVILISCVKSMADEQGFFDPNFHNRNVGSSARELLTDDVFKSLKIEVQYMKGAEPDEESLENLQKFLNKHLHKPNGITVTKKEIPAVQDSVFHFSGLLEIEKRNRTAFTSQDEITVYILYVNGYHVNEKLLGYAYKNTSAVLFVSKIKENSDLFKKPSRTYLESRVLQHEFAHLLGLVNVGTPNQDDHHDEENGKHCKNKRCLMYHLTDTEDYPSVLIRQAPPKLDKHCLKDLRANGGK